MLGTEWEVEWSDGWESLPRMKAELNKLGYLIVQVSKDDVGDQDFDAVSARIYADNQLMFDGLLNWKVTLKKNETIQISLFS
jgi:hypothetical protein